MREPPGFRPTLGGEEIHLLQERKRLGRNVFTYPGAEVGERRECDLLAPKRSRDEAFFRPAEGVSSRALGGDTPTQPFEQRTLQSSTCVCQHRFGQVENRWGARVKRPRIPQSEFLFDTPDNDP